MITVYRQCTHKIDGVVWDISGRSIYYIIAPARTARV